MEQSSFSALGSKSFEADTMQMVSFRLGKEKYALSIMVVKEVLSLEGKEIYRLPNSPDYIEGIFHLRGEIVPLISLHEKFNLERVDLSEDEKLLSGALIVIFNRTPIAIHIDKILRVLNLEKIHILPVPEIVTTGIASENIQGVYREEDGTYLVLLNLSKLFSKEEVSSLTKLHRSFAGE